MTRRDFQLIAGTIAALNVDNETRVLIANAFTLTLRSTNGAFNRDRFVDVCMGVKAR